MTRRLQTIVNGHAPKIVVGVSFAAISAALLFAFQVGGWVHRSQVDHEAIVKLQQTDEEKTELLSQIRVSLASIEATLRAREKR